MSAEGSTKAIIAAFAANLGIAVAKRMSWWTIIRRAKSLELSVMLLSVRLISIEPDIIRPARGGARAEASQA